MTRHMNLDDEVQLALQIEANNPGSEWATQLRRKLQEKNECFVRMRTALDRLASWDAGGKPLDVDMIIAMMRVAREAAREPGAPSRSTEFAG